MTDDLRTRLVAAMTDYLYLNGVGIIDTGDLADAVIRELDGYSATSTWRTAMNETRPDYILAIRAQALDEVQELIAPDDAEDSDWIAIWNTRPKLDVWRKIVEAAFPPPPIAGSFSADD